MTETTDRGDGERDVPERKPTDDAGGSIGSILVPDPIRRNLVGKLVLSILLILVVTGGIGVYFYFDISDQLEGQVIEQNEETAALQSQALETWFDDRETELDEIRQSFMLTVGNDQQISSYLERELAESRFVALHLVEADSGTVLGSTSERAREGEIDFGTFLGVETLSERSFLIDEPYENADGEEVIAMGQAVPLENNRVLVAEIETSAPLSDLPSTTGETVVVDAAGTVVLGDESAPSTDVGSVEGTEPAGSDDVTTDVGDDNVYSSTRFGDRELYVQTSTPTDEAFAVRDSVLETFGVTLGLTGFVLVLVGIVGGRRVVADIDRLADRAAAMERGDLAVDLRTNRIDEIGSLYGSVGSMRDALREQISQAEQARHEAEAERERVQRINDELEAAAQEYCAVMEAAADGDLTVRANVETDNESMKAIGRDFNEMLDDIEATLGQVQAFAGDVATASKEVTASSEEVRSASERVATSIQEISEGAERQHDSLRSVTHRMEDLSTTTEQIAASASTVADTAERTARTGQEGREAAQAAIAGMNEVESEAEQAVEEIGRLEEEVAQIDDLIDFIAEIAEQTNMLALNANIEASRASGDESADEGFGVVAQEVKQLSDDAKEAADEIERRLERIREQTDRSAAEVQQTSDEIADQAEQIQQAVEALDEIAAYAERTNDGVQEISAATEQQAASTEEVVAMVDDATTISEDTTSEAESVAAAAEEQTAALTAVSENAGSLAEGATRLSKALDRFETQDGATILEDSDGQPVLETGGSPAQRD